MTTLLYFEDLPAGTVLRASRPVTLDRDAVLEFARAYDPQPAHLGEEAAAASQFGTFCASGWQTVGVTMRMMVETMPIAGGGMGAGVEKLNWPRMVFPGDTLTAEIEILSARVSRSRPDKGVAQVRCVTRNQRDEVVLELTSTILLPRKRTA
ncbi:MAG: MaoC family dehydratase [Rhodospirillales bacterium]|nr:MaoC family dehydratase [Rhodospirillales bacterium]